jgi:glycosyltransferase involved in cell wall biosynthesis
MNILLISRCPPWPLHLGDRLIIYHLVSELELVHHNIDLLAFSNRPEDADELDHYDYKFRHVELIPEPTRTPLDYAQRLLWPPARFPASAQAAWSPAMWQAIERRLDAQQYDVVHLFGGVHVYEVHKALRGLPTVITPYESYSLYLRRALEQAPHLRERAALSAQQAIARGFERFMFTPYQRTVVVAERDRDELHALNPMLPIDVIPNGVDLDTFRVKPTPRLPDTLLFTGNYEYAPNVDAALWLAREILPSVQARIPDVKLWLVGNAPPPEMQALASETVKVTGRVPDIKPYLARATAFVSPLRLGAGIKNKVLEALALGCPVVATPISVDGISVTDGQDALVADNDALVDAVVRLLKDTALQAALSDNGRRLIEERYSWARVAALYERLYHEVSQ